MVVLWEKGVRAAGEIGFLVGISARLAGEYLALRERYDTSEHRDRLEEIARQVRRALSGEGERIKVLLRKDFDVPTICRVSGKAPKTVAQYLVIVEAFHPGLLNSDHRAWLHARRRYACAWGPVPRDELTRIATQLERKGATPESNGTAIVDPGASGEADLHVSRPQPRRKPRMSQGQHTAMNHSPDRCPKSP